MSNVRWRGWLAAATLFLLGIAVGAAGTTWLGGRALRRALQTSPGEPSLAERAAVRIGANLTQELQLTADESARVQAVLNQSAVRLKTLRRQAALEAAAELRATTQRIAAELPPEKRAEYQRIIARRLDRLGVGER